MSDQHIKIDVVTGGKHGHHLMHCYFEKIQDRDGFNFFDPNGAQIRTDPSPVCKGEDFSFDYDEFQWNVHRFKISEKHLDARGHWKAKPNNGGDNPESGTFQAQAGGSVEGELRSSASASA